MKSPESYIRLGDIASIQRRTVQPDDFEPGIINYYSFSAYDSDQLAAETDSETIRSAKLVLTEPCVLLSKLNPHISRVWLYRGDDSDRQNLASTEFVPLVPEPGVSIGYLYAACLSASFRAQLLQRVNGTSTSHQRVRIRDLVDLKLPPSQGFDPARLGTIVESLERRLRLSRQATRLAVDIIRQAFRQEFPNATTEPTARLGSHVDVITGASYSSDELRDSSMGLVTLKCFGTDGRYQVEGERSWVGDPHDDQLIRPGDVLIAQTDLTRRAEVLGMAIVPRESENYDHLAPSLDVAIVRPVDGLTAQYLLGLFWQPEFRAYCKSRGRGTTVLHLPRKAIPEFAFRPPAVSDLATFTTAMRPWFDRLRASTAESATIEQLQAKLISHHLDMN